MNDEFKDDLWERRTVDLDPFDRPQSWPERRPIVSIVAWTLMPNHFHLLLKETTEGGIAKFLQKLCGSMTVHFNLKYKERGSIFQGAYRGRTVDRDEYLQWLASYIMVKNTFELYPGGLSKAADNFEKAWEWAEHYPFSSFKDFTQEQASPLLEPGILGEIYSNRADFKKASKEMILARTWIKDPALSNLVGVPVKV